MRRRDRDPERRDRAEHDADPADRLRAPSRRTAAVPIVAAHAAVVAQPRPAASRGARRSFRRGCSTRQGSARRRPTKRTTRPWMMSVRLPGELRARRRSSRCPCVVPYRRAPKRRAARPTPTRRVAAEQRDGDAEEADGRALDVERPVAEVEEVAEHVDARRRGRRTRRDRHRLDVVLADVDPAVGSGVGVEADRAHLVAERRPVEDQPEDDERGERHEEADVDALRGRVAPEVRQLRAPRRSSAEIGLSRRWDSGAVPPGRRGSSRSRSRSS